MKENKSKLGGEPSGHIVFSDNGYCGDGILTAMYIINILKNSKTKLSMLSESLYNKNYQNLVNVRTKKILILFWKQLILKN